MKTVIAIFERIAWMIIIAGFCIYAAYMYLLIRLEMARKSLANIW